MQKIEAIIRPSKLEDLKAALENIQIRGMTASEVKGRGLQNNQKQYYRGREVSVDLNPKIKVEIVCHDESVENIISTIINSCRTGKHGDGKIFVYPLERVIRISTREEGAAAL
ncbi:MAG TPA: P-II family nitrogen regulator [Syntrophomonadaceae bacterium]|jgi:nitrogen regulatory protein P-II 1|nr:P-II family nitrogen regulator [Syntrophomonadaceae bacterium]